MTSSQIDASTPLAEHASWGALEHALAERSQKKLDDATKAFEDLLETVPDTGVFSSRIQAEAAAVLATLDLYVYRLHGNSASADDLSAAAYRIYQVRKIIEQSEFPEAESYGFELQILQELLSNGYLAYMSSPREEGSQTPQHNSDLYIYSIKSGTKVPVSVKLGAKKSTHYSGGVRSISRKEWQRKTCPLVDYLRMCIPEIKSNN